MLRGSDRIYRLGGEDLTAIVNSARRRNRSLWDILEELERQPGLPAVREILNTLSSRLGHALTMS